MAKIPEQLTTLPGFSDLLSSCANQDVFLVGGALRDWHLGRAVKDIDLATAGNPSGLARQFASRCGGHWFWLDRQRQQSRVVLKRDSDVFSYDFSPLRAADLAADLKLRDFTINALAVDLGTPRWRLIDPLGALADIKQRHLRPCSHASFRNDPLRILRGLRFALQFGLYLEPETEKAMASQVPYLKNVAGERIHSELASILGAGQTERILHLWHRIGLNLELFGAELAPRVIERLESRFRQLESVLVQASAPLQVLSESVVANNFSRKALVKFFLMLSAEQTPSTDVVEQICDRLSLGKRNSQTIKGLLAVGDCGSCPHPPRAQRLWLEDLPGDPKTSLLLLFLSQQDREGFSADVESLVFLVSNITPGERLAPLVEPARMIDELGYSPGAELGRALDAMRLAEIREQISTPAEAETYLLEWKRKSH